MAGGGRLEEAGRDEEDEVQQPPCSTWAPVLALLSRPGAHEGVMSSCGQAAQNNFYLLTCHDVLLPNLIILTRDKRN